MAESGFRRGRGVLVTGTDTEVGKTVVAGAIARCLAQAGHSVGVFKPVASGCQRRREGLVSEDAEFLSHCSGSAEPLEVINPVRYHEPLAPWVAAQRSGVELDRAEMCRAYNYLAGQSEVMVVEGVGGVMVPLGRDYAVLDLMVELALPVVVVAASRLGAINHTLLTVEASRARGLEVLGVVINGYQAEGASLAQETNPRVIAEVGGVRVLSVIPFDQETCVSKGRLGREVMAAASLVDWWELFGS